MTGVEQLNANDMTLRVLVHDPRIIDRPRLHIADRLAKSHVYGVGLGVVLNVHSIASPSAHQTAHGR